jgi:hypothetical protein
VANAYLRIAIVIILLIVVVGIVAVVAAIRAARQSRTEQSSAPAEQHGKYPEGHWLSVGMGIGIALGAGLGVPIGIALGNVALGLALGPGMGVAIGVAIGSGLEQKHKDEIRPLTGEERRMRTVAVLRRYGSRCYQRVGVCSNPVRESTRMNVTSRMAPMIFSTGMPGMDVRMLGGKSVITEVAIEYLDENDRINIQSSTHL